MADSLTFRVTGLRELLLVVERLPKDVKREIRSEIRAVAVPVRDDAQRLFETRITPDTKHGRYGISLRTGSEIRGATLTVEQRVKSKYSRQNKKLKRPKFADLQLQTALEPALSQNESDIIAGFNRVVDRLCRRWAVGI